MLARCFQEAGMGYAGSRMVAGGWVGGQSSWWTTCGWIWGAAWWQVRRWVRGCEWYMSETGWWAGSCIVGNGGWAVR